MEFLLLRKPKPQPPKQDNEVTFTGLDVDTGKVPKKTPSAPLNSSNGRNTALLQHIGMDLDPLQGPNNSPDIAPEVRATRPPLYEEPPLVNLLDLATVAPKPPPLFTLNDFVSEALASQTIGNNLQVPVKSRENFSSFHSTPNGLVRYLSRDSVRIPPVLHVQDVLKNAEIPEAEAHRKPKQQRMIEMRAMIREAMQNTSSSSSEGTLALTDTPPLMLEEPYPDSKAVFCGGLSRFFQGEARSDSPFYLPEDHCITISKTAIFNSLREGGRKLSLRAHFIASVPDITPLSLTIVDLNLSFNNFRNIPVQVQHLPNLLSLTMRNNPIIQLPSDMSGLPKLQELNLSFCLIHYIPDGFFSLPSVEDLNLSYNHLTEIPASIVNLASLGQLNLDGNQLPGLPFSVLGLTKLQTLRIKNNFTSQRLWNEHSSKTPLSLKDMCGKVVVDQEIDYTSYCTEELSAWVDRHTATCECCGGSMVGAGLVIVRSIMEKTFTVRNLPLSLKSCGLSCFYEYKRMKNLDYPEGSQSSFQGMTLQQLTQIEQ